MSDNVIYIPGRVKSIVKDGHAMWAEDIYDTSFHKTQQELNSEMKSITDQMVISIEGGDVDLSGDPDDIHEGSGKVPTGNAVALKIEDALLTIDTEPTEDSPHAVSSGGVYDALEEKYEKPVAGIPSTDMTEGVQTALSKANTALQRDDIADLVTEQGMTLYVEEALQPVVTLIPAEASTTNQLADKEYVNSIGGTFRGDYNSLADLENIPNPKLNDYAYYVVGTSTGTLYKKYRYTTTGWEFEYDINNSSFTAAQWAAINSQATQELTAKLSALPTASELNNDLAGKQDTINDLADIRSGAALGATAVQTETDPTVPSWAKQQSKPSYSYSEISGAPTNVSAFTNDVPYVTESEMVVPSADTNGHEYVDLGLPSGTLWATMNVGASAPEGYGNYYMYGYTTPYNSSDTPYSGTENPLSLEHDAARVNWGGDWKMPTKTQFDELIANTTFKWTTINGINGGKFTAKNGSGNYIFIPVAGYYYNGSLSIVGNGGCVWTSTPSGSSYAFSLRFDNDTRYVGGDNRNAGYSVRGVLPPITMSPKYATKQELNTGLSGKAEKSEMSVTAGTGADADKTTIQLKTGTSATVLTQHQDISGKAEKSEMSVTAGTGTDADKTTITLKTGTSATVLTAHQDISGKQDKVTQLGSTQRPVYINSNGEFSVCDNKCGGTSVMLNNEWKGGTTISFYAPISSGTNGQYLKSNGNNNAPVWDNFPTNVSTFTNDAGYIASQSVRNVVVLTQQEYDALATKDNYTEYNIV